MVARWPRIHKVGRLFLCRLLATQISFCLLFVSSNLPGFLTVREREALEEAETRGCQDTKWLPLSWCCQLVQAAREEGYIDCEGDKNALVNALVTLRRQCGRLLAWHHFNIPLVYTQVCMYCVRFISVYE